MMLKLLVILLIIKLYARNNVFENIKEKHGQEIIRTVRSLENLKTKYVKVLADIKFIKSCKSEDIIPTFAKVNVSLKHGNYKLQLRIPRIVMEAELQNKNREKSKLKKEIKNMGVQLKIELGSILYNTLIHQINKAIGSRRIAFSSRHKKKLEKFWRRQHKPKQENEEKIKRQIIRNFSSYVLSHEEYIALSYGLDTHIPSNANTNKIYTEFEMFYQNLLKIISNIPETKLQQIKTKLLSTCDKYAKIKVLYKHRKIVNELSKRNDIVILKVDKGRGAVILDRRKCTKKCLDILNTTQFQKLDKDPTKTMERKVQNILRKIKSKLTINEYKQLYPSGSSPGKFYGTAKIHKLSNDDNVEIFPIRPIISNIGTATYSQAKYLSKLTSPLSSSEYTVSSTKDFVQNIQTIKVPTGYHMVSFDVKSLLTNVPLEYTIDLILKRIYDNGELSTDIIRSEMEEMLTL